jgi:nucleotide-binding universal stress UspA family protein
VLRFQHILVPTDFSPVSAAALEVAIEFALRFEAELVLIHAHEMPAYLFPDAMMPVAPEVLRDLERAAEADLRVEAAKVRARGLSVVTRTVIGPHDSEILRYAAEWPADLIVMGTHGRTGLRHALLGSVAEKVVRHSTCPVVTVHPPPEARPAAEL